MIYLLLWIVIYQSMKYKNWSSYSVNFVNNIFNDYFSKLFKEDDDMMTVMMTISCYYVLCYRNTTTTQKEATGTILNGDL